MPFGAPCNICEPPSKEYAQIRRYNADGSGKEVIATGVRNSVGFDWHPKTKELWFTDHGRDWAGDDGPQDELNRLTKAGQQLRLPVLPRQRHGRSGREEGQRLQGRDPAGRADGTARRGDGRQVLHRQDVPGRVPEHDVHRAQGLVEPRRKPIGFDVVNVRVGEDGKVTYKPFVTGFQQGGESYKFWGRPAYVAQMPDGALLRVGRADRRDLPHQLPASEGGGEERAAK